jgi:hypothetical protein
MAKARGRTQRRHVRERAIIDPTTPQNKLRPVFYGALASAAVARRVACRCARVGDVKNNDPSLIEPIAAARSDKLWKTEM